MAIGRCKTLARAVTTASSLRRLCDTEGGAPENLETRWSLLDVRLWKAEGESLGPSCVIASVSLLAGAAHRPMLPTGGLEPLGTQGEAAHMWAGVGRPQKSLTGVLLVGMVEN